MRILLCNDDGIHSPGLLAIYDALTDRHGHFGAPFAREVLPIAPFTVQSATGHGITYRTPLIVKDLQVAPHLRGLAVDGRPADCIKLGLASLWPERFGKGARPDLVISGINLGANVGINVLYSGTCAAALEAAFLGVPAIALSLTLGQGQPAWTTAAFHARTAIERLIGRPTTKTLSTALPAHACLNINLPITERDSAPNPRHLPALTVCPMNVHGLVDKYTKHHNPLGETYYWSAGTPMEFHGSEPGKDVDEVSRGRITITPLRYDLTDSAKLDAWTQRLHKLPTPAIKPRPRKR
jgi:5'-nucleotidase